jgi:hypothetical protein
LLSLRRLPEILKLINITPAISHKETADVGIIIVITFVVIGCEVYGTGEL